jgi:hypothetical protein
MPLSTSGRLIAIVTSHPQEDPLAYDRRGQISARQ